MSIAERVKEFNEMTKNFTDKDWDEFNNMLDNIGKSFREEREMEMKYNEKHSTPLYDKLKNDKMNGVILDFSQLSEEVIEQLWEVEHIPDSLIADLYSVRKSQVTYRRKKFGITCGSGSITNLLKSLS